MDESSDARRVLDRIGDCAIIGVLTAVACLGVLTVFAALGAAFAVLTDSDDDPAGSLPRRYATVFRTRLARSVALQAVWAAAALTAAADLLFALNTPTGWVRLPMLVVGGYLATVTAVAPPFAAARHRYPNGGVAETLRDILVLTASAPVTAAGLLALGAAVLLAGLTVPIAVPLLLGGYASVAGRVTCGAITRAAARHGRGRRRRTAGPASTPATT